MGAFAWVDGVGVQDIGDKQVQHPKMLASLKEQRQVSKLLRLGKAVVAGRMEYPQPPPQKKPLDKRAA